MVPLDEQWAGIAGWVALTFIASPITHRPLSWYIYYERLYAKTSEAVRCSRGFVAAAWIIAYVFMAWSVVLVWAQGHSDHDDDSDDTDTNTAVYNWTLTSYVISLSFIKLWKVVFFDWGEVGLALLFIGTAFGAQVSYIALVSYRISVADTFVEQGNLIYALVVFVLAFIWLCIVLIWNTTWWLSPPRPRPGQVPSREQLDLALEQLLMTQLQKMPKKKPLSGQKQQRSALSSSSTSTSWPATESDAPLANVDIDALNSMSETTSNAPGRSARNSSTKQERRGIKHQRWASHEQQSDEDSSGEEEEEEEEE